MTVVQESLYDGSGGDFLAKLALEVERALAQRALTGGPGRTTAQLLARGDGWIVEDVICTAGPHDRPFEEQHSTVSIAIVVAGSFQYRAESSTSRHSALMTPGSLLLGNPGQHFECGHAHGAGDRCISFRYTPDYFASLEADARARDSTSRFSVLRLPPVRALSPVIARSCASLAGTIDPTWEELSIQVAAEAVQVAGGVPRKTGEAPGEAVARVTQIVRKVERHPDADWTLAALARCAELSPYHFLRLFERVTGVTPHQYVLRARLREAATRLTAEPSKILDIALDCGFGDVSNFNRAFRAEFGVAPRAFRARHRN
jgi:AraC-like DNA-binding protein